MTRIEKMTIQKALEEYVEKHSALEQEARNSNKLSNAVHEMQERMIASGILTYWNDIVNAVSGAVKI